jgi:UDP-GlcNAc3NAcA epimerase
VSDLLFAPTSTAINNLRNEGLASRALWTGDSMYDAILHYRAVAAACSRVLSRLGLDSRQYALVTVHRAENTDDPDRLGELLRAFDRLASRGLELVWPMHPRSRKAIDLSIPGWRSHSKVQIVEQ